MNFELGTSCKLAAAGGVSHTGNYGSNGSNGMGESAGGKGNFELCTSCKLAPAGDVKNIKTRKIDRNKVKCKT